MVACFVAVFALQFFQYGFLFEYALHAAAAGGTCAGTAAADGLYFYNYGGTIDVTLAALPGSATFVGFQYAP
jgi:hypothetical protein